MVCYMKQSSTVFLKLVIILIAGVTLTGMLWFPQIEGRNATATQFQIYFQDPFLAYTYIASIPFFIALYQAFKLLGYIEKNKVFSSVAVKCLRNIKYCGVALAGFIAVAMPYIVMFAQDDDSPGFVLFMLMGVFISIVIATAAGVFQKLLQSAVDLKSENDLTV